MFPPALLLPYRFPRQICTRLKPGGYTRGSALFYFDPTTQNRNIDFHHHHHLLLCYHQLQQSRPRKHAPIDNSIIITTKRLNNPVNHAKKIRKPAYHRIPRPNPQTPKLWLQSPTCNDIRVGSEKPRPRVHRHDDIVHNVHKNVTVTEIYSRHNVVAHNSMIDLRTR
jgi:hypothetical protein